MITVGIDPGLSGAIVVICEGEIVTLDDTPTSVIPKGKGHRTIYNESLMFEILSRHGGGSGLEAFIEKSAPMPGQGVVSVFSFGYGVGLWIGMLTALKIPYTRVHPATWRRRVMNDMPKGKDANMVRAKELYPMADIRLKKHHGRADAILIGHYGINYSKPPF